MAVQQRALIGTGLGLLSGFGLKYLWDVFRLPGYGQIVLQKPLGAQPNGNPVYLGADDVLATGAGGAVAVWGARTKNATLTGFGVGTALGVMVSKYFETMGSSVVPAACNKKITPIDYVKC